MRQVPLTLILGKHTQKNKGNRLRQQPHYITIGSEETHLIGLEMLWGSSRKAVDSGNGSLEKEAEVLRQEQPLRLSEQDTGKGSSSEG